jgi:hypothetical protein
MPKLLRSAGAAAGIIALAGTALWFGVLTTPASRSAGRLASTWHRWLDPGPGRSAPFLSATAEVTRSVGLPDEARDATFRFRARWPDQLRVEAEVEGKSYLVAREDQHIRFLAARSGFHLLGRNGVPRFAADPDSATDVVLPPLPVPAARWQLALLPALVDARWESDGRLAVRPRTWLRDRAGLPDVTVRILADPRDLAPREFRVTVGDGSRTDVALSLRDWRILTAGETEPVPSADLPGAPPAEEVALSHLLRFSAVLATQLSRRPPPPQPADGRRVLVAESGAGRLERHDGLRVAFLRGTPEEMGRQHGDLLREEVRSLTERILYGVGVGSSLGKGRWFFGEIESAAARLRPHLDPRYLREADALAAASGLHPEETRLTNVFPELFHCSGFALHGTATRDGRLYHGRVLDYLRGVGLEPNAVVFVVRPDEGHAWANVGYAGFLGTVTAMNERRIAVGEMGGRGEGNWDGKPMAHLLREVMERASTLDEAVDILRRGPRTCEYYYVVSDGNTRRAVGVAATPDRFEVVACGEPHPLLPHPVPDAVLLSAGSRYEELVRRVRAGFGTFDAASSRDLMTRPVCMESNIQSVLFAPETLDFWVANADRDQVASHTRYVHLNLGDLLGEPPAAPVSAPRPPAGNEARPPD